MSRLLCGALALSLVLPALGAEEQKAQKTKNVTGAFDSFKDGTLTIKVKGKKGEEPKATEFKLTDDVKVTVWSGDDKKEATVKDAFKDLKPGTQVTLAKTADDKIVLVTIGTAPKPVALKGTFETFADGSLTIKASLKKGEEAKPVAFKVADDFKVTVYDGDNKKELTAKEALKDLKPGVALTVTKGPGDKVVSVTVGTAPKKNK
jgi:hypothetical protein